MNSMFSDSKFNQDISDWNLSKVKYMNFMFAYSDFNQDISKWNVSNVEQYGYIFNRCPIEIKEEYKPLKFRKFFRKFRYF